MYLRRGGIIEGGFERGNSLYYIAGHEVEIYGLATVAHGEWIPAEHQFNHFTWLETFEIRGLGCLI